ncbi:MAG: MBL fold metallo-hydrolase [Armatimonadetes bacterium]|nr:MBL fold metallo-hydrolase [Armatimonadota bacterium]
MSQMDLIVFNVEHGLCVFVRTPSGHGIMVDIGCSDTFKPAKWLSEPSNIDLTLHNGKRLAWLVVTHPHDDHVEGVDSMIDTLQPAILVRHTDLDWHAVLNPPDGDPSSNAKRYYHWQGTYNQPVASCPELGCSFDRFALSPERAQSLGGQLNNVLNNSSYVSVITWPYAPVGRWKVVVCGDNEEKGLEALLEVPGFAEAIAGADILVTPHHGHSSGYSGKFLSAIGNPLLCISSVPAKDPHVDSRYSSAAQGVTFNGGTRSHLTTRGEGHIWATLTPGYYRFNAWPSDLAEILRRIRLG